MPAATRAPEGEEQVVGENDIVYVVYYRDDASSPWVQSLPFLDLSRAQEHARMLEKAWGVETKILKRGSN